MPKVVSCTLSGGGSRASFQVGALQYLYRNDPEFSPSVFVAASAGAILAAGLSQFAERNRQSAWMDDFSKLWLAMGHADDMFTPRSWYRRLRDEGPSWLEMMQPAVAPREKAQRPLLPSFLARRPPEAPSSPPSPVDPLEYALTQDEEMRSEWSLQQLSTIVSNLGRLSKIGSDMSAIWSGMEQTRSMYRPGPVLRRLLEPEFFDPTRVAASGVRLRVALVALESGELRFMTEQGQLVDRENEPFDEVRHDLTLGVLASCSIPGVFRAVPIDDETYVDGGTRENIPAELAIGLMGASVNYVVSSNGGGVRARANMADDNVFSVVMRATEILMDEANRDELEYAISANAIVIYPTVDVHDSMFVHPGYAQLNSDHGWLRAADVRLGLDRHQQRWHRRIIEQRLTCLRLEQRWLDNPCAENRQSVQSAKERLRTMLLNAVPEALPEGSARWWQSFEAHPEPISESPWWL